MNRARRRAVRRRPRRPRARHSRRRSTTPRFSQRLRRLRHEAGTNRRRFGGPLRRCSVARLSWISGGVRLLNWLQFVVAALELPADPRERHFWGRLARLQLIYSLAGLLLGLACGLGGGPVFFYGGGGVGRLGGGGVRVQEQPLARGPGTGVVVGRPAVC